MASFKGSYRFPKRILWFYFPPDHCAYPLSDHEPVLAVLNIFKNKDNRSNAALSHKKQSLEFGKSTSILLQSFPYHTLIQPAKLISFFTMNWKDFGSDSWKWTYGTFGMLLNICKIDAIQYSFKYIRWQKTACPDYITIEKSMEINH